MPHRIGRRGLLYPTAIWAFIVLMLFGTEYGIMLALPAIFAGEPSPLVEALIDALLITCVLAPVIWLLLVRPLRQVVQDRTRLLGDLFATIEAERTQTARELHDGIGQELSLLISGLRSAQDDNPGSPIGNKCGELRTIAQTAMSEARRIARGLRPSLLDDFGLAVALEKVVTDSRSHSEIDLSLQVSSPEDLRLPEPVETAAFRVFQEALANVLRHSHARHVTIKLAYQSDVLTLVVRDDGNGFDSKAVRRRDGDETHTGVLGMRERVALLNGDFNLKSAPGEGCEITARFPIDKPQHHG